MRLRNKSHPKEKHRDFKKSVKWTYLKPNVTVEKMAEKLNIPLGKFVLLSLLYHRGVYIHVLKFRLQIIITDSSINDSVYLQNNPLSTFGTLLYNF